MFGGRGSVGIDWPTNVRLHKLIEARASRKLNSWQDVAETLASDIIKKNYKLPKLEHNPGSL
jgi:hypothetical protein